MRCIRLELQHIVAALVENRNDGLEIQLLSACMQPTQDLQLTPPPLNNFANAKDEAQWRGWPVVVRADLRAVPTLRAVLCVQSVRTVCTHDTTSGSSLSEP